MVLINAMHPASLALAGLALAALLIVLSGLLGAFLGRRAAAQELARLKRSVAEAEASVEKFEDLTKQVCTLRHDLRGMLSPAMLVADRLLDNQDPGIKRAGEMVIRTVERMTARLAETKLTETGNGQEPAAPPAP